MKVLEGLGDLPSRGKRAATAVSIGNFDGVHTGHLATFAKLDEHALARTAITTVITFDPHPQAVLRGEAPPALVTLDRKLELLEKARIQQVLVMPFTKDLSRMEPEEFIEVVLVDSLLVKAVVVGSDFRFGRFARGDVPMLRAFAHKHDFVVAGTPIHEVEGRRVSSTAIRHALEHSDVEWANKALGRPHSLPGTVVAGAGRGVNLGYPTANLEPIPGMCVPSTGIYAGMLRIEDQHHQAAISVGTNPTFGENPVSVEAFVLDMDRDIYGMHVEIEFVARLRSEKTFATIEELVDAIDKDVSLVRSMLGA